MFRRSPARHALCLAVLGALATPVYAQESQAASSDKETTAADSSSVKSLGKVTVSARKRDETLQEVPVAVTAFTPERLETLNVQDLGDLDAQVPNLTVYAARGSSSTVTAYIRGIGQSDPLWGVDPGVGIYLDDVYIARPQGALLDVFDVERIEVLRGPQGTLYGKNTIGGAIKYISKELPKTTNGFGSVTVGNYGQLDVKGAIGGPILGTDALRARLSVASLHRDGFGTNLTNGQPVSDKEILALRGELGAFVSDDFDIKLAFDWMDDQSGVRGAKMLAVNPLNSTYKPLDSRYDIRSGMGNVNDTGMKGVSATATWRMNPSWTAKYVIAKRESDTSTDIDFDTLPGKYVDVHAFYSDEQLSNELQLNYDGGGRARGVMGAYMFSGEAGGQVLNYFHNPLGATTITNPLFGDTQGKVITDSFAVYTDWSIDLSERLGLDIGARWTDEKKHAIALNKFYTTPNYTTSWGTAANFDKTIRFKNLSPKLAVNYDFTQDIMGYVSATRGFKSGGYNIRANTTSVPRSGDPFRDEQVDSLEVGTKMGLLDQSLFLNFAYFHNKYKDIQLSVFTEYTLPNGSKSFFGDFTNAGAGTIDGFEVEYQWMPSNRWLISGNLAWMDSKYTEFMSSNVNIADTQYFTNAPEFSGAFNIEHRLPMIAGGELTARAGYTYQSSVWPTTDLSRAIYQEGYGLVNAGLIWRKKPWTVSLQGSNLTDEEYRTTGYNIAAYGVLTGFYGAPRQYSLTVRYDF